MYDERNFSQKFFRSGKTFISAVDSAPLGSFVNQTTYYIGWGSQSVAVGDFNNDTHLDIVVTNLYADNVAVFLRGPNGVVPYQIKVSNIDSFQPTAFVIADFNNEDRMDIGVTYSGMQNVGIFLGYGNFFFEKEKTFSIGFGSFSYSIAAGDFIKYYDIFCIQIIITYGFHLTLGVLYSHYLNFHLPW